MEQIQDKIDEFDFSELKYLTPSYKFQYLQIFNDLQKKNPTKSPSLSLLAQQIAQLIILQKIVNDAQFKGTKQKDEDKKSRLEKQADAIKKIMGGYHYSGLAHTSKIKELTKSFADATELAQREVSRLHRFVNEAVKIILKFLPKEFDTPGGPAEKIKANLERLVEETLI